VRYNDYLGIVYKDDQIREIGVLAKVIGIFNQFSLANNSSYTNQLNSFSYVKIEVLGRIKILDYQRHNKESQGSDIFFANVELLEDEISKNILIH
jgi:hypothetical protein